MQRRYISDKGYAVFMIAIGIGIYVATYVFGRNNPLIKDAGLLCYSLGCGLMSVVRDRKRRGLDGGKKQFEDQPAAGPQ